GIQAADEEGPSGDGRTSLKVLVTNDFGSFGRTTIGFITSDICALLIKMKPFLIKRQLIKLVAKCVATGGGSPVSNIGSDSVKSDVPDTINVVSRDTYTVNDDVTSKRQCIQQSDCGPVCGFMSSVTFNEPGVLRHQQCSTRHAECRPGSNVSLPELSGCPCVLENSQSSVRSNAVSTSNVTDTCLGNCILVGYPYYRFVAFVSSFGYIHHVVCILLTLYVLRLSLADTVTTPAAPNIGPPSSYAHLGNCDHNCQHYDARFCPIGLSGPVLNFAVSTAQQGSPVQPLSTAGILGPASSSILPPSVFNTMTLQDSTWNIDIVRQFTRDNNCTVEFDAFGFSVRDFLTRHILLRCDSSGDLYPVTPPSPIPKALLSVSPTMWHQRLGHPEEDVLRSLVSRQLNLMLLVSR
ncbi:hypothetical protein Tco_1247847, partial [Tanacetum coccineum]